MEEKPTVVIFGVGGVGSWVAEWLTRQDFYEHLILVDGDEVEEKNLTRQNYAKDDVTRFKAYALGRKLASLLPGDYDLERIHSRKIMVTTEQQLLAFPNGSNTIALICTDNVTSKRLIANYFERKVIVNCDKGRFEIKTYLDREERTAWDMGGGYSQQDIVSNVWAAAAALELIINEDKYDTVTTKVDIKKVLRGD